MGIREFFGGLIRRASIVGEQKKVEPSPEKVAQKEAWLRSWLNKSEEERAGIIAWIELDKLVEKLEAERNLNKAKDEVGKERSARNEAEEKLIIAGFEEWFIKGAARKMTADSTSKSK